MKIVVTISAAELKEKDLNAEYLKADMLERLRACECDGPHAGDLTPADLTVVVEG